MVQFRRYRRSLFVTAAVFAALLIAVVFVVPPIARSQLQSRLSELLGRQVTVEKVRINPFTAAVTLENFAIQEHDAATTFLKWNRLHVNAGVLASLAGEWVVDAIELEGFFARGVLNPDRSLNVSDILARLAALPEAPASEAKKSSRPVRVSRLRIADSHVDVSDLTRARPFTTTIGPLTFELSEFRTSGNRGAPYRFEAVTEAGEKLAWSGTLQAEPFRSAGELRIEQIVLPKYGPYFADHLRGDVSSGVLSVRGRYEIDLSKEKSVMKLSGGGLQLRNLAVRPEGGAEPIVEFPSIDVSEVEADALAAKAVVGAVRIQGGRVRVQREADGSLNLLALLKSAATPALADPETVQAASETKISPAAAPNIVISEIALQDLDIDVTDHAAPRPTHLGVKALQVGLKNVTLEEGAQIPVEVSFGWVPQGSVRVSGTTTLKPLSADLRVEVGDFALLPLSAYAEQFANVHLTQGAVSTKLAVRVDLPSSGAPRAEVGGDIEIATLGLVDGKLNEDLAGWRNLALRGLRVNVGEKMTVHLNELSIGGPYARAIMAADKTLNLATLSRAGGAKAHAPAEPKLDASTATAGQAPAADAGPTPNVSVDKIVITDGDFRFEDRSVKPAVAMAVSQFGGTIAGLSATNPAKADVALRALVDGSGAVDITGKLDPLGAKPSVDLKVDFKNVDLVPLSPYSGRFAGYELARGKLVVDVKLLVDGKRIDSANVVTLNQFTFGNAVESADATKLPVRLAVALLKDMDGKIVIDLPVQGNTDDPNFRIGRVVLRVVTNLLTKAAVSPFTLLGAAFGGGGDELAYQEFAPGTSDLLPSEASKLETMVKALTNRPGLSLDVDGSYDAEADAHALKQVKLNERVRRAVWEERRQRDPNIPPPEAVVVSAEETEATIRKLFSEQFPPGTEFGAPVPPAPVIAPPPQPPAGFFKRVLRVITFAQRREIRRYEEAKAHAEAEHQKAVATATAAMPLGEMTARLAQAIGVDENELRALATARAQRVRDYFVSIGKIAPERVFLAKATGEAAKQPKGPRVFLSLQ